jgi:hypothetical protein
MEQRRMLAMQYVPTTSASLHHSLKTLVRIDQQHIANADCFWLPTFQASTRVRRLETESASVGSFNRGESTISSFARRLIWA